MPWQKRPTRSGACDSRSWFREAERELAENPFGDKARIVALALLGYAVLFGALGLLIALIAGTVWAAFASTVFLVILLKKKLAIPLAGMAWIIMRALWVCLEPPRGYVAKPRAHPVLHARVRELRRRLAAPRVHEIIIVDDLNAGVVQTPCLGVFGWSRNTLLLGLPLLLALTPEPRGLLAPPRRARDGY